MISERRLVYLPGCVCQISGSTRETITWICLCGLTQTHTQHHSFTPDMSSLCFSTEDIPTGPDRTLRTVGPAGTVPASSTGMWMDVSSCESEFLHIYRFFYMRALRAQCVSRCTVMCITLSFPITSVLWLQFHGMVGLSFCSVWQHSQMQHFEYGHSLRKYHFRFDHWTQL